MTRYFIHSLLKCQKYKWIFLLFTKTFYYLKPPAPELLEIEFTTYWIFMPFNLIFFWPSIKFMTSLFLVISALISFQYVFPFQMLIPPNRTRSLSSPMSPNSMMSSPTRLPAIPSSMPRPRGNLNNLKSLPPPSTCGSGSTSL